MSDVSNNGIVLHFGEVVKGDNTFVSGGGDEDINVSNDIIQTDDFISLHASLKGTNGITFRNIHSGSTASHGSSTSLSNISEATNKYLLSRNHDISGSVQTVNQRVFASIDVIKFTLGN